MYATIGNDGSQYPQYPVRRSKPSGVDTVWGFFPKRMTPEGYGSAIAEKWKVDEN